jgi:large subunit ribosomal protein L13
MTKRETIKIDATGKAVGRLASQIATILRGKHKPTFVPRIEDGDAVVVLNAGKVKFTGRKLEQKDYYHHSMHPGGIKRIPMKGLFEKNPNEVIRKAVLRMLPDNRQKTNLMLRLSFK